MLHTPTRSPAPAPLPVKGQPLRAGQAALTRTRAHLPTGRTCSRQSAVRIGPRHERCKLLNHPRDLKRHHRTHTGGKTFVCQYEGCERLFTAAGSRNRHHRTHRNAKTFADTHESCGKAFARSDNLKAHRLPHAGAKRFICAREGCERAFTRPGYLKAHLLAHSGKKPFACPREDCRQAFTRTKNLKTHLLVHSGKRPFVCPHEGCEKAYMRADYLTTHLLVHAGKKPFVCSYQDCGYASSITSNLKRHRRTHSGERPFLCSYEGCGRTFAHTTSLTYHLCSVHTKEKRYSCPYENCGYLATQSNQLSRHLRIHTSRFVNPRKSGEHRFVTSDNLTRLRLAHTTSRLATERRYGCKPDSHEKRFRGKQRPASNRKSQDQKPACSRIQTDCGTKFSHQGRHLHQLSGKRVHARHSPASGQHSGPHEGGHLRFPPQRSLQPQGLPPVGAGHLRCAPATCERPCTDTSPRHTPQRQHTAQRPGFSPGANTRKNGRKYRVPGPHGRPGTRSPAAFGVRHARCGSQQQEAHQLQQARAGALRPGTNARHPFMHPFMKRGQQNVAVRPHQGHSTAPAQERTTATPARHYCSVIAWVSGGIVHRPPQPAARIPYRPNL